MQQALGAFSQRLGQRMPRPAIDQRGQQAGHEAHLGVVVVRGQGAIGVGGEDLDPRVEVGDAVGGDQRGGGARSSGQGAVPIACRNACPVGQRHLGQRCRGLRIERAKAAPIRQGFARHVRHGVDVTAQRLQPALGRITRRATQDALLRREPGLRFDQAFEARIRFSGVDE